MQTLKRVFILLAVLAADQLSKLWLKAADIRLLPGILRLRGHRNTGAAFGLFGGSPLPLTILSLALVLLIAAYLFLKKPEGLLGLGLTLVLGGALGNLVDRLFLQYVIDFIELELINFPVFNIADIAVTAGCALAAIGLLQMPEAADG